LDHSYNVCHEITRLVDVSEIEAPLCSPWKSFWELSVYFLAASNSLFSSSTTFVSSLLSYWYTLTILSRNGQVISKRTQLAVFAL
jgi:hypothetical protein